MNTVAHEQLIGQLNWRYAVKQFDAQRKISPEDWAALEDALVLTPSSFGLMPWKVINVTDPALRHKLVQVSHGQAKVAEASHLLVFAVKTNFTEKNVEEFVSRVAEVRGASRESLKEYQGAMAGFVNRQTPETFKNWAARQAYIALGNFLTSAAMLGIDVSPMEGFEPAKYNEILGLDKLGLSAVVIAAAGYRAATDPYAAAKKVRFPKNQVVVRI